MKFLFCTLKSHINTMKQKAILLAFTFLFSRCFSQDSISFQMHYLPNHKYETTTYQRMRVEVTYIGNDTMMNILKDKGIENPTVIENVNNSKMTATTGGMDKHNEMPFELVFVKSQDKDGKPVIPNGTKIFGSVPKDKMPVLDSIVSDEMGDDARKKLLTL